MFAFIILPVEEFFVEKIFAQRFFFFGEFIFADHGKKTKLQK